MKKLNPGRPVNTFNEYKQLKKAYERTREEIRKYFKKWNVDHPELKKFSSLDLYLCAYLHYCIPENLRPPDLGTATSNVRGRLMDIIYPILSDVNKSITEESYAAIISKADNLTNFLERLSASRVDNPSQIPYIIPGSKTNFKDLYVAGYVKADTNIVLRTRNKDHALLVNSSGKVEMMIDGKIKTFGSPTEAGLKGLSHAGFNQWKSAYVLTNDGQRILLDDYRKRFESEKPFPAHFDSILINKNSFSKISIDDHNSGLDDLMRVMSDTERHGIVRQRIGQDEFRKRLIKHWGSCAITGLKNEKLLRASHAKPWKDCSSDKERLDVFNGFLLAPHFDVLFDQGLMTFENTGAAKFSSKLSQADFEVLGLNGDYGLRSKPQPAHLPYLEWHRKHVFIP